MIRVKSTEAAVPVAKVDANSIPSLIDRASRRLAEAKTSAEVLEAKAAAELALHYAKVTKAANESHADCLRIITRAEIRMASEIDRGQSVGEVAKREDNLKQTEVRAPDLGAATLKDLGVKKQRVAEWRKVAEAGEEKVEQAISEALAEGRAPTKADVHRAAGIVKDKPQVEDADREYADLQAAWDRAGPLARRHFLAWNDLTEQPKAGTHGAEACKAHSNAVAPASSVKDGRANAEHDDVDRSAERASSAVEVGATNSPDGANEAEEVHLTGRGTRERGEHGANRRNGGAVERRISEGSPAGEAEDASVTSSGGENPASNSQSAVPTAEAAADTQASPRPSAAAEIFEPGPHSPRLTTGGLHTSSDEQPAQNDSVPHAVGQDRGRRVLISGQSEHQSAGNPQGRNEPVSGAQASVTPFNNPACQKPDTCHLAHSRNECFDCNIAWSKRPKDEQVRLWAEAIQAARAA